VVEGIGSEAQGTRDYRLDVLRGLAICLVMLWHLQPLRAFWQAPISLAAYVFNYEVALTAVPVLFLVSLLLLLRRGSRPAGYVATRVGRLAVLLAICFVVQVGVCGAALRGLPAIGWHELCLGGPALPNVGDSVFYFLVNLLLLTVLACGYALIAPRRRTYIGLAVVLASLVLFEVLAFSSWSLPYYSPLNFLLYIPLADLAVRHRAVLARYLWLLAAAYLLLACQDVLLHGPFAFSLSHGPGDTYARASLVAGALALVVAFQRFAVPQIRPHVLAGRYSLGLFVVHKWVWYVVAVLAARVVMPAHARYFVPVVVTGLSIVLSCLVVALLARTPARFLVTGAPASRPRAAGPADAALGLSGADMAAEPAGD
jgi:peptidoglycan/LPS O-acetylase OafA/YrhL